MPFEKANNRPVPTKKYLWLRFVPHREGVFHSIVARQHTAVVAGKKQTEMNAAISPRPLAALVPAAQFRNYGARRRILGARHLSPPASKRRERRTFMYARVSKEDPRHRIGNSVSDGQRRRHLCRNVRLHASSDSSDSQSSNVVTYKRR